MEARHFEEDRLCRDLFLGRSLSFLDLGGLCGDTRDGAGTTGCVDGAAHDLGDSCRKADVTSAHKKSLDERRCLSSKATFRCDTKPGGINVGNAARKKSFLRGQASPFVKRLFVRGRYVCLPAGVAQVMRRAIHTASRASTIASVTTKTAKVEKG
jgi:hypothetical protein